MTATLALPHPRPASRRRPEALTRPPTRPLRTLDEDQLAADRLAAGDEEVLRDLGIRYGTLVHALAYRIVGDHHLAEECTQDVFLTLWRRARDFDRRRGSLSTWLLAITRNRAIELTRRRAVRRADLREELDVPGSAEDPADAALRTDTAHAIASALVSLPAPQLEAVRLAFVDGLTHTEIASRLDLPLGTVKGRVRLGLERLAATVDPSVRMAA